MGNLVLINNSWYIDGKDEIKVDEEIEILQTDGSWRRITIGIANGGIYCEQPQGLFLSKDVTAKRPND